MQQLRKNNKKKTLKAISWLEEEKKSCTSKIIFGKKAVASLPGKSRKNWMLSSRLHADHHSDKKLIFFLSVPSVAADERGCEVA